MLIILPSILYVPDSSPPPPQALLGQYQGSYKNVASSLNVIWYQASDPLYT